MIAWINGHMSIFFRDISHHLHTQEPLYLDEPSNRDEEEIFREKERKSSRSVVGGTNVFFGAHMHSR